MLLKLMKNLVDCLPLTLKEAHTIIKHNTKQVYWCEPNTMHNAVLKFVTGEEIEVNVTVLYKDPELVD